MLAIYLLKFIILATLVVDSSTEQHYYIQFEKIDNRADILVNDSLVYTSGTVDFNPDLGEQHLIYLNNFLSEEEDKVVIRVYNGHEPYSEEKDTHWEVRYLILENEKMIEYVWEDGDDGRIGLVHEMTHYL